MADSDLQLHQYNNDRQPQQQQQQPMSSGLMRYRSAPSSYFASLLNSSVGVGEEDCDEFLNPRPSSPETERILARLLSGDGSSSHNLRAVRQNSSANEALQSHFMVPVKGENNTFHHDRQQQEQQNSGYSSASQMIYQNQSQPPVPTHSLAMSNAGMDNSYSTQMKIGGGGSNLIRQSSSPAGLLSHVNLESGYGVMRGMGNVGGGSGTDAEAPFPSSSRLKGQIDFPTGPSSSSGIMTSISENESKRVEISGTGFPFDSWDDSAIFSDSFLKRLEDDETKTFSGMNASENQNDEGGNCCPPTFLSHHLSLPKTSVMEKLLQLQDSVPCKIRAKRGFATHPRSIAERVRRTRISERMRKLQDLVPNMDKQTNTSDMLDLAVDYIKDLQNQVKIIEQSVVVQISKGNSTNNRGFDLLLC